MCVCQDSFYLSVFVLFFFPFILSSFAMFYFVSDVGVPGCIWAMLPGAVVKLEQSLQVNSLRRPDNTLYYTFYGKVNQEVCWSRPTFQLFCSVTNTSEIRGLAVTFVGFSTADFDFCDFKEIIWCFWKYIQSLFCLQLDQSWIPLLCDQYKWSYPQQPVSLAQWKTACMALSKGNKILLPALLKLTD